MEHIRKWFYRPKRDDSSLLAQFFYADEALNVIANELDSFDGRKDPERCTALVNQLRQSQDKVLTITNAIMDALIGDERANRDFRAKFPEDVLQENLAGQLWFGAECLAAGSSIMNREFESAAMRPLAKAVTKSLENVRNLLRSTCLRNNTPNSPIKLDNNEIVTEMLLESLKIFDRLFAEFELAYVSAMVPVKSTQEYELQEMISVHFSETLQRALKMKLITQEMVDDCDPALMFTVPRLAIVSGLLSATSGPLCIDKPTSEMSEMFRPFRTLLLKIRELLWTLNRRELYMLEKLLCHNEEIDDVKSVSELDVQGDSEEFIEQFYNDYLLSRSDYISYVNSNVCDRKCKEEDQGSQASGSKEMVDKVVDFLNSQGLNLLLMSSSPSRYIVQPYMNSSEGTAPSRTDDQGIDSSSRDCDCLTAISEATTTLSSLLSDKVEASKTQPTSPDKSTLSSPNDSGISENASLDRSPSVEMEKGCCCGELREEAKGVNKKDKKPNRNVTSPSSSSDKAVPKNVLSTRKKNKYTIVNENGIEEDVLSTSSSDTSSFHSNCADDLEIAMAVQAAEMASRNEVRAKYSSSEDLIHRLFVCVAGVADQLQTNFASDLRNILKSVFLMNASDSNETTEEKIEPCPSLETSIEYRPTENEVTENNEFSVDPNILAQEALFDSNIYFRIEEENNEEESNAEGRNRVVDENGPSDPGLTPAVLEVTTTNGYTSGLERQNEPETEQPPMWIPDIEAPKCMSCGCNFTVVKRRHHCRNCGKVFCSRCSSNSVPLPKFGIVKPVRVCNKCFMYNLNPFTVRPYM